MKSKLKPRNEFGEDEVQYEISTSGDKNNHLFDLMGLHVDDLEEVFITELRSLAAFIMQTCIFIGGAGKSLRSFFVIVAFKRRIFFRTEPLSLPRLSSTGVWGCWSA